MEKIYERIREASERTGIPEVHLRRMIHSDVLPKKTWTRLGRRYFIHRENIDAFLVEGGAGLPGGWRQEPIEQSG